MTNYYAVDVRDIRSANDWYKRMEALGFNLGYHHKLSNFTNVLWFYFDEGKNYITYLTEADCNYDNSTGLYEYDNDFEGACQWFIDGEDCDAIIEEFQLSTNSFYYGQL